MNETRQFFSLFEVCQDTGLTQELVFHYIEQEWISPHSAVLPEEKCMDHEDLARIKLILELQQDFGINDDAIPVILHLIDQLHGLRNDILKSREENQL